MADHSGGYASLHHRLNSLVLPGPFGITPLAQVEIFCSLEWNFGGSAPSSIYDTLRAVAGRADQSEVGGVPGQRLLWGDVNVLRSQGSWYGRRD